MNCKQCGIRLIVGVTAVLFTPIDHDPMLLCQNCDTPNEPETELPPYDDPLSGDDKNVMLQEDVRYAWRDMEDYEADHDRNNLP